MEKWQKYYLNFVAGAALNAGIFVSYRLYMHHLKNKLKFLSADTFRAVEAEPCLKLDFSKNKDKLETFTFELIEHDPKDILCAFFSFKNTSIILRKLNESYHHYSLDVDLAGCYENNQVPNEVARLFMIAAGLKDIPVIWTSDVINSHVSHLENIDLDDIRVQIEKRRVDYIKHQQEHTKSLQENLQIIPLKKYKPLKPLPVLELNFTKHEDSLELIEFDETDDDLGNISIATFKYDGFFASIQRYHEAESLHYNVYLDLNKTLDNPESIAKDMLRALELRNIPISWVNSEIHKAAEIKKESRKRNTVNKVVVKTQQKK